MANLYELNEQIANFRMEFDPDTGEWINEADLDALQMTKQEKIEQLCLYAKNLRSDIKSIKEEEKNLADRRKRKENKADRIEAYVASNLAGEKFSTPKVEVVWRKSESVEIEDDYAVPDNFCDLTIIRKPSKNEIKKYLKKAEASGIEVTWAKLEEHNKMSIK